MVMDRLRRSIRHVQDFPKEGIGFKDITTLLKDPDRYKEAIDALMEPYLHSNVNKVVGIEARGFLLASAIAYHLHAGLVPVRKPGKLPAETIEASYELEYGTDTVAMHVDAIEEHSREGLFDYVIVNNGRIPADMAEKYMRCGQYPVSIDRENLENRGFKLVEGDIVSRDSYARHDAAATAALLIKILASVYQRGSGCKTAGS